jgi:short-subunit dehydrogenase
LLPFSKRMNIHSAMTIRSKTILITGATSGIGRAAALMLARRGHRVFATGRNEAALAQLEEAGLDTFRLDVTDPASVEDAVRRVEEATEGRGLDVLINNAGYGVVASAVEIADAELRGQFETNVFGLVAVTRAFAGSMISRGAGRIINVSSVGGRVTLPLMSTYNATKYAVESLSDGLRLELRPLGIDVALIEPGLISTNFNQRATRGLGGYRDSSSAFAKPLARFHAAMHRTGSLATGPERVARALVDATESRRPRARYVVPKRTFAALWLSALLPTRAFDAILRRVAGLRPSQMRAVAAPPLTGVLAQ